MGDLSHEPSMEDILSSIKKIIAEDADRALSAPLPRRAAPRPVSHDELGGKIELTPPEPDDLPVSEAEEEVFELTEPAPLEASPVPVLVSETAANASRSALESLSAMVVKPEVSGSDTLEGLVREMLRPMLKDWLDANLPVVVERLVSKEIARITGKTLI
jgi:uncharacterized protein